MARKDWSFELEDGKHTVELDHGYFSGKRKIWSDGKLIIEETKSADLGSDHVFKIGSHTAMVTIRNTSITPKYDLAIDGRSVTTGEPVEPLGPFPLWTWLFVAGSIIPPFALIFSDALGVCDSSVIGGVGGGAVAMCLILARGSSKTLGLRIAICAILTAAMWGIYFLLR